MTLLSARATVAAVAIAICATLLPVGTAHAADRRPDGITGYAFDARCAPTQAEMGAWLTSSPFWGVGVYIGGSTASCRPTATDPGQLHLDATWVSRQRSAGWRVLPIWVGPQAACHPSYADRIDGDPAGEYAAAGARGRSPTAASRSRSTGTSSTSTEGRRRPVRRSPAAAPASTSRPTRGSRPAAVATG